LYINDNAPLACVHAGQFNGLSNLAVLRMDGTKFGVISTGHFARWSLNNLETLRLNGYTLSGTSAEFQAYNAVLPALITLVLQPGDGMSDPICGSIAADTDGSGFHTTVQVRLDHTSVYPNRVQLSGTSGDGFCGSETGEERRHLWTWQRSADGVTWADIDSARQPKDYGDRAEGECSFIYTPHADDHEMYVRAYVPVNTTGITDAQDYHSAAFGPLNVQ